MEDKWRLTSGLRQDDDHIFGCCDVRSVDLQELILGLAEFLVAGNLECLEGWGTNSKNISN